MDLQATVRTMSEMTPQYRWRTVTVSAAEAADDVARVKPDFIFAPAGFAAEAVIGQPFPNQWIVTRKTALAQSAEASTGRSSSCGARAKRLKVRPRAQRPARPGRALRTAWAPRSAPRPPPSPTSRAFSAGGGAPNLRRRVARGRTRNQEGWVRPRNVLLFGRLPEQRLPGRDLGAFGRSGRRGGAPRVPLESIGAQGWLTSLTWRWSPSATTAWGRTTSPALACRHSTALYPDVSLLSTGFAPESVVRDVTIAMLTLPTTGQFEWRTNVSHAAVRDLFQALEVGPYAHLRDMSPRAIFSRWKTEILVGLLLLFDPRRERTAASRLGAPPHGRVRRTMEEKERVAAEAAKTRLEFAGFERRSIVQQMSGMIAHEINGPVGAIRTYAAVLKMGEAQNGANGNGAGNEGADKADDPARRIREEAWPGSTARRSGSPGSSRGCAATRSEAAPP